MFTLRGAGWPPQGTSDEVLLMAASQGALFVLSSGSQHVLRLSPSGEAEERVDLARASGTPQALFVDPHTALSLIVAYSSGENCYAYRTRSRVLGKARGIHVTAVAWLRADPAKADTREVLLASSAGVLYEASIDPLRTRIFRQVFTLSPPSPIHGLQLEAFPAADERCLACSRAECSSRA